MRVRQAVAQPMRLVSTTTATTAEGKPESGPGAVGSSVDVGGWVGCVPPPLVGFGVGLGVGAAAGSKFQVSVASPSVTDTPSTKLATGGTPVPIATVRPMRFASGYCALKAANVQGDAIRQNAPVAFVCHTMEVSSSVLVCQTFAVAPPLFESSNVIVVNSVVPVRKIANRSDAASDAGAPVEPVTNVIKLPPVRSARDPTTGRAIPAKSLEATVVR